MFRRLDDNIQVLLVHPGGPFWSKKDDGAWSIPKGEHDEAEDPAWAARREFLEETGAPARGSLLSLGTQRQRSGKLVAAFAVEGDFDVEKLQSNSFEIEWPPRTGRMQTFPEVDRADWFTLDEAEAKILPGQRPFLLQLRHVLGVDPEAASASEPPPDS